MDWRSALMYVRNGSVQVVEDDPLSSIASGVIIALCLLVGLSYSLLVIGATLASKKLKRSPYHVVLMITAMVCLLDTVTNESIALGFLFDYDPMTCRVSAMTFHMFLLIHSASLGLIFLERALELQGHMVTVKMSIGGALAIWVFGLVISSALLGTSETHFFPNRNACGAVANNIWASSIYSLGFLLCWGVISSAAFICVRSIRSHLADQPLTVLSVLPTFTNAHYPNPLRPLVHSDQNKLSFTILFLHVILLLPQTLSVVVNLFSSPDFKQDPWIDPRVNGPSQKTVTTNSLEPLFAYSRYIYNAVIPITILATDKPIRVQSRWIFCCRWNEVSSLGLSEGTILHSSGICEEFQPSMKFTSYVNTPVLFATPEGLHLRVAQIRNSARNSGRLSMSRSDINFKTIFCDVKSDSVTVRGDSSFRRKTTQTIKEPEVLEDKIPAIERIVRFSSKVDEIVSESGVWSSSGQGSNLTDTHTVTLPLFVKSDPNHSTERRESCSEV